MVKFIEFFCCPDKLNQESEIELDSGEDADWTEFDNEDWSVSTMMIRKSSRKLHIENIFHLLNTMHYSCETSKIERNMRDEENTK